MSNAINLTSASFQTAVSGKLCLVDFYADWCGPCKLFAPILDEIAAENQGSLFVGKVNVTDEPDLAARFEVRSIPTILIMKDGKEVRRFIGLQSKQIIQQALKNV